MQRNTKNNKYRFQEGSKGYIIIHNRITEFTVIKRLRRPHRLSDNFYFCLWNFGGIDYRGIKYEKEMFKDLANAKSFLNAITGKIQ